MGRSLKITHGSRPSWRTAWSPWSPWSPSCRCSTRVISIKNNFIRKTKKVVGSSMSPTTFHFDYDTEGQTFCVPRQLCYLCIPHGYIHGCIDPRHDIENCWSYLYICLWLFKYTKFTAVFFFYSITLSLEMSDEP